MKMKFFRFFFSLNPKYLPQVRHERKMNGKTYLTKLAASRILHEQQLNLLCEAAEAGDKE